MPDLTNETQQAVAVAIKAIEALDAMQALSNESGSFLLDNDQGLWEENDADSIRCLSNDYLTALYNAVNDFGDNYGFKVEFNRLIGAHQINQIK